VVLRLTFHYPGYLNFSTGHYHYVFFDSQRDPDNDPVVLWLNGGPGCSSLIGMSMENGPFVFVTNTTTFTLNENAWNKKANVLYLESPGGVSFIIFRLALAKASETIPTMIQLQQSITIVL
jgi:carboxypeptidase C (cathepsin A)